MSNAVATASRTQAGFELRFASLFNAGRALAFPCDAEGHVDMAMMSRRERDNYLMARSTVGREYAAPMVRPSDWH